MVGRGCRLMIQSSKLLGCSIVLLIVAAGLVLCYVFHSAPMAECLVNRCQEHCSVPEAEVQIRGRGNADTASRCWSVPLSAVQRVPVSVGTTDAEKIALREVLPPQVKDGVGEASRLAADKNLVMDELLSREELPEDYAEVMIGLYGDRAQDELTRSFAIQHLGLYVNRIHRQGGYDPETRQAADIRETLFRAASELQSTIVASAFRALADIAVADHLVDSDRVHALYMKCIGDASAAPAARAMAIQLCGELNIVQSLSSLRQVAEDAKAEMVLRLSARHAIEVIEEQRNGVQWGIEGRRVRN